VSRLRFLAGLTHYAMSRISIAPPGPTPIVKRSPVVVIGVGRGGVGRDNSWMRIKTLSSQAERKLY
jgi:hypothetical protein